MQNTMVTEKKPLIAIDGSATKVETAEKTTFPESEKLITLDDLAAHKEKRLMRKLIIMVVVVNVIVLVSIILCN